jgi:hypothetical protein
MAGGMVRLSAATVVGVSMALAACTLSFDRFDPEADGATSPADTGSGSDVHDAGQPLDAPDSEPSDAGCMAAQGCFDAAGACGTACGQTSQQCQSMCPNMPCRNGCIKTEQTCRLGCGSTCTACAGGLGCNGSAACAAGANTP